MKPALLNSNVMFQGEFVRSIITLSFLLVSCANADQPAPVESCFAYKVDRIDEEMGRFVLKNVFAPQLFEDLQKEFPRQDIDWSAWRTSVNEYKDEDGTERTELEGCFDISEIYGDSELVSSIMRISAKRFQAAMEFYSTPDSDPVPDEKVDPMIDGYEQLLEDEKVKEVIEDELEHNKSLKDQQPQASAADVVNDAA